MRHREYDKLGSLLPTLTDRHEARTSSDPDFVYLSDQVAMATETRGLTRLPLSEDARKELRASQEAKALEIENRRRLAKGLEPLDSLSDEPSMGSIDGDEAHSVAVEDATGSDEMDAAGALEAGELQSTPAVAGSDTELDADADADADSEDEPDVLLLEAGRILADTLALNALPLTKTASR